MLPRSLLESPAWVYRCCAGHLHCHSKHHNMQYIKEESCLLFFPILIFSLWGGKFLLVGMAPVVSTYYTRNGGQKVSSEILCWRATYQTNVVATGFAVD